MKSLTRTHENWPGLSWMAKRRRDKQLCDGLYSCLGDVKQCNLPLCPCCVQRLRISLALRVRACLSQLRVRSELPMSFFQADVPGGRRPIGRLNRINLPGINHLIKGQLKALRLPLVFAGVNISVIENRFSKTARSRGIYLRRSLALAPPRTRRRLPRRPHRRARPGR
jgi:hypothetical protein